MVFQYMPVVCMFLHKKPSTHHRVDRYQQMLPIWRCNDKALTVRNVMALGFSVLIALQ